MPKLTKPKSEFGKGFAYNIALFTKHFENHFARLVGQLQWIKEMPEKKRKLVLSDNPPAKYDYGKDIELAKFYWKEILPIWGTPERLVSQQIEMWANGASDHLYELEIPEHLEKKKIGQLARKLQSKALEIGHGFRGKTYKYKDFVWMQQTALEIMLLLDKELGLKPEKGEYE